MLPATNQFVVHPRVPQPELRAAMGALGVTGVASSPLDRGAGGALSAPELIAIARDHGTTPGQVVLRWEVQLGVVPIPRARSAAHMAANLDVWGFTLSDAEMAAIGALQPPEGPDRDPLTHEEF